MFAFTTVSNVSGSIEWIGPFPLSAGFLSADTWTMGTQSSYAFFRPCIAFVSSRDRERRHRLLRGLVVPPRHV